MGRDRLSPDFKSPRAGIWDTEFLACEQALLFGRVKRVSRERASERSPRSRVLARLTSLTQIGELARRLLTFLFYFIPNENVWQFQGF